MFVDVIEYSDVKRKFYYKNRNFEEVLTCIAFKFDITFNCTIGTKVIKKPKFKQTKIFICKKCFDYFKVKISLKQIGFLLKPQKGKFPYTSILIIQTIYNLLKEDVEDLEWKIKLDCYLKNLKDEKCKYERFLLEDISEKIVCHKDEYMLTEYSHIVEYFIATRESFYMEFDDFPMIEHSNKNFPCSKFLYNNILDRICVYEGERTYIKIL